MYVLLAFEYWCEGGLNICSPRSPYLERREAWGVGAGGGAEMPTFKVAASLKISLKMIPMLPQNIPVRRSALNNPDLVTATRSVCPENLGWKAS